MSLGGIFSLTMDSAVELGIKAGIHFTIAAGRCLCCRHRSLSDVTVGNSNLPVVFASPARAKGAVTVGAVDSNNRKACFSNFGPGLIGELLLLSLGQHINTALVWDLGVGVLSAVSFRISRATLY